MITPNEKLQRARLEKRWSVAVASQRVGVSTNTFSRWERGLQIPQLTTLDQLCATFAMSAGDLGFGFVVSPQKKTEAEQALAEGGEETTLMAASLAQIAGPGEGRSSVNQIIKNSLLLPGQQSGLEQAEEERFSRQQVIAALIGTPAAIFGARQGDNFSLLRVEEILTVCASHIPLCWELYFEGGSRKVEMALPGYISQLLILARHPSAYQKRAAAQLSQAYQLASLLATQRQDYGTAYTSARQALFYGELAEDPNLQVAALIRQALVHFYLKRTRPRLRAYQKALLLAPETSPLLQGRVYIGLTEVCSRSGQEDEARRFCELAQETFPAQAEEDPNYAYTHFTHLAISLFEGIMYINLNQSDQAWALLAGVDHMAPVDPVPERLELTVRQAAAAAAMGERDLTCQYIETAVPMARELGSQLRVDESYEIYEQLLARWGDDPPVKELEELFHSG